jgi:hypothetical protein
MNRGHEWADAWLRLWAQWQRGESYGRGYPDKACGFSSGGAHADDAFDHMCEESDSHMCVLVDAAVGDCKPIHSAAIMHAYGVAAVWRMRQPVAEILPGAMDEFERLARMKGVV